MLRVALIGAALLVASVTAAPPPIDAARERVRLAQLSDTVGIVTNRGGNVGVVRGRDALLIIDGGFEALSVKLIAEIAAFDPRRPGVMVVTHWHRDHVGLTAWVRSEGAQVIAQQRVADRVAAPQLTRAFEHIVPPLPEAARPDRVYGERERLDLGDERVRLIHVPRAHTDGDTLVKLERANVLFMGDAFVRGLPFIERASDGSIDGLIAAVGRGLALSNAGTRIVPGHGAVARRGDLLAYRDMLRTVRKRVAEGKRRGLTLKQVQAERPAREWDDPKALPFVRADALVADVYLTLP